MTVTLEKKNVSSTYRVQLVEEIAGFQALADEWPALLQAAGIENIALRFEWLQAVLDCFPQERVFIVTVRDAENRLVGAAPFAVNRGHERLLQRSLRYLRILGAREYLYDCVQFPIDKQADQVAVLRQILDALTDAQAYWDVLELYAFQDEQQLKQMSEYLNTKNGAFTLEKGESMPKMALPASMAEYDADKSKKRVHRDVKRFHKKIEEALSAPALLETDADAEEMNRLLDRFFEQHAEYWLARTGKSSFKRYPQLADFYKTILQTCNAAKGYPSMSFSVLRCGEHDLSYQLGMWHSWGYMNYMNSYNPEHKAFRAGILHMDAIIRQSLRDGYTAFSFGQGEESYKDLWAEEREPLWHVRYYKTAWISKVWQADMHIIALLKQLKQSKSKQTEV